MINLDDIAAPPPKVTEPIDLSALVAQPNFRPRDWQSRPDDEWSYKPAVDSSPDLRRIVDVPRRPRPEASRIEAMVELITARFALERGRPCACASLDRECISRLRPVQAWALFEMGLRGGLLGPVGVGHGKTILDILAPLAVPGCSVAVLLVPPGLLGQLEREYTLLSQHFRVPSLAIHVPGRGLCHVEGAPVLNVIPYSRLCRPESTALMESITPDLIIADECHRLRNLGTAGTSRVVRYFREHPGTRFCGWSGSITDSSIRDFAHLSAWSLREGSPLPIDPEVVIDWARAVDPVPLPAPAGALLDLCDPGEHVRDGFRRRMTETCGVVTTVEPAVDVELVIRERTAPGIPESVRRALVDLRDTWVRPDGEELVDALAVARCARELACGFYYRWIFPRGESVALIEEWLEARKNWRREVRYKLADRVEHLDSEDLCKRAAMRAWGDVPERPDLPSWKAGCWPRWRDVADQVKPETEAVRVDDYLVRDAADWAWGNLGVVWYEQAAFGAWLGKVGGLPVHGGGAGAESRILSERGDRSIVASIKSHGTGRDGLQRIFCHQLVANPPSSSMAWEQVIGRLHRIGQDQAVVTEVYRHTPELRDAVDDAMARAQYVQQTIGAPQKLTAGWRSE